MPHPIRVLLLDANVLASWVERTVYVTLNELGIIELHWSEQIERDLIDKALPNLGKSETQIKQIIDDLHVAVPDWKATPGLRELARTSEIIDVPDRDDLEVLAAAIAADADVIVTKNIKDFSREMIQRTGILIEHSRDVLAYLNKQFPYEMSLALAGVTASTNKPLAELFANAGLSFIPGPEL